MSEIFSAVRTLYSDAQSSCLSVSQIGAASNLKILLLTRAPCLNVIGLDLQISQISRAAFDSSYRNIH